MSDLVALNDADLDMVGAGRGGRAGSLWSSWGSALGSGISLFGDQVFNGIAEQAIIIINFTPGGGSNHS